MSNNFTNKNRKFIINELKNYFDSNDWTCEYDAEKHLFTGEISLEGPLSNVTFIVFAGDDHAVCYHILPFSASLKERPQQAEFLTRVNCNLLRGYFEMDFEDGEIRYKHRISLADIKADIEEISYMLFLGCSMIEQYSPGIIAISFGKTPEEAYLDCCADPDDEYDEN